MKVTFLQVHSLMKVTFNEATHSKNRPFRVNFILDNQD